MNRLKNRCLPMFLCLILAVILIPVAVFAFPVTGSHKFKASYSANEYTVSFDANSGICAESSMDVTYDAVYGALPTPERPGYEFTGWYTAKSGGTKVTAETVYETEGNTTLYAHWTEGTYTVTFNYGSCGSGSTSTIKVTYGSTYPTLPSVTTTSTNYTFAGWWTSASGGTQISTGDPVAITGNTTLYAMYLNGTTSFTDTSGHEIFTYSLNKSSKTMTITGLTAYGLKLTSITIPPFYTVNGVQYAVTSFTWTYGGSNNSNAPNTTLKTFTISDSVTSTTGCAFHNSNHVGIGDSAFKGCTSLTTFASGDGLTSIPSGMFYGCTSLKYVSIGSSATTIGMYAFQNCTALQYIVIPDTVTDMSAGMQFKGCTGLVAVYLSKNASVRSMSSTDDCAYAVFTLCNHNFNLYVGKSSAAAYGNSYWHCYTGNTQDGYTPAYPTTTGSYTEAQFRAKYSWTY